MILFSGLYDVALAQSPQMRMASLTGGTARQVLLQEEAIVIIPK
jgi:hypothetical protein